MLPFNFLTAGNLSENRAVEKFISRSAKFGVRKKFIFKSRGKIKILSTRSEVCSSLSKFGRKSKVFVETFKLPASPTFLTHDSAGRVYLWLPVLDGRQIINTV